MDILIIEDDAEAAAHITRKLGAAGHRAQTAADGPSGLVTASSGSFDLLIVDRMLPGMDGLALVKKLREDKIDIPVLFLTTMSGTGDRVDGLNAGGDDYVIKPFASEELLARVNALGRRPRGTHRQTYFKIADLEVDLVKQTARRAGAEINLQAREFQILAVLVQHAGNTVTRTMLLETVWRYHFDPGTNMVESHVSRLRSKVDKAFSPQLIHTVRPSGYCLRGPD